MESRTQHIVICLNDDGNYIQSTRRRFTKEQAEHRSSPIAASRRPVVVEVPAVALDESGYPMKDEDGRLIPVFIGEPDEPTLILTAEGEAMLRRNGDIK